MHGVKTVRHIVVLAPNWLGDAVMATPVFRLLKRQFPQSLVTVAGRESVCRLLDGLSSIDRFQPFPAQPSLAAMWRIARELRRQDGPPDCAVVLPHSFRAALLARLAGAKRRLGYDRGGRRWLLSDAPPPHRENGRITPIYMTDEYVGLLRTVGCEDDGQGLELHADPRLADELRRRWAGPGPLIGLAPGAAFGPSKRWPAERYAAVADALAAQWGARCVLLTGPGEEDTRDAVHKAAATTLMEPDIPGEGVAKLKAAISILDLFIGNDSGPRHVAVAFGAPVVCIMGPTKPAYSVGPYEHGRVLRTPVYCGPCQQPVCHTDHRCMTRIRVEDVLGAAHEILTERTTG